MGRVGSVAGMDLDAEWKKLEARMDESDSNPVINIWKRKYHSLFFGRIAIAVVLVLAISFGSVYIYRNTGSYTLLNRRL